MILLHDNRTHCVFLTEHWNLEETTMGCDPISRLFLNSWPVCRILCEEGFQASLMFLKVKNSESKKRSAQFPGLLFRMNIETCKPSLAQCFSASHSSSLPPFQLSQDITEIHPKGPEFKGCCALWHLWSTNTLSEFSALTRALIRTSGCFFERYSSGSTTFSLNQLEVMFPAPKHHLCYPQVSSNVAMENPYEWRF